MVEWYVVWVLTVQTYAGEVKDRHPISRSVENHTACMYEANAKLEDLETQLGSEFYKTEFYDSLVPYGGKLIGVKVKCEGREKTDWRLRN